MNNSMFMVQLYIMLNHVAIRKEKHHWNLIIPNSFLSMMEVSRNMDERLHFEPNLNRRFLADFSARKLQQIRLHNSQAYRALHHYERILQVDYKSSLFSSFHSLYLLCRTSACGTSCRRRRSKYSSNRYREPHPIKNELVSSC